MQINLTDPQSLLFESESEWTAGVAGFGSGKTDLIVTKIYDTMAQYPGMDMSYLAPTYPLIRDIFYPKISELLTELGLSFKINKSENTVYIRGLGKIFCRTMMNPDTIVGWQCGDAFLDEFDILPMDKAIAVVNKITARCRQEYPDGRENRKLVTTTPEGFKATYNLFKNKASEHYIEGCNLIQMSTYSNAHNLPKNYISNLRKIYPDNLIEAYLLGEFVNLLSGTVYRYFDRNKHNTKETIRPHEELHIGQDFNYGGCVSSVFVIRDNVPYLLDGYVSTDTEGVVEATKSRFEKLHEDITFYPDCSGNHASSNSSQTDISILRKAGFAINAPNKNPFITDRVNCMNVSMNKTGYFINVDKCPLHAAALEQQAFDLKTGKPQKIDQPASIDDYNDSQGYFISRKFPINRPQFGIHRGM